MQGHFELAADLLRFVQPLGEPDASVPVAAAPQAHAPGSSAVPEVGSPLRHAPVTLAAAAMCLHAAGYSP